MSDFTKFVELEIAQITESELHDPEAELEEGDNIVGEMTDYQKRLWTVYRQYRRSSGHAKVESEHGGDAGKAQELTSKADTLKALFWIDIDDEFHLWGKTQVGIRKGWKVVWGDAQPILGIHFPDFFDLFGL